MKNLSNYNVAIINFFFLTFPLSVIVGNLAINLIVVLLCLSTFIFYTKKILDFKLNLFDKIIIIFFLNTIIVLIINFFESYINGEIFFQTITVKTLFYLRYLVLYIVLRVLVSNNILKLKWFSYACVFYASFVCFDIFFQFYFGKDIFGIEPHLSRHYSGVFGKELVAGGFLQKFALFSFFLPFVLRQTKLKKIFIQFLFLLIFGFGLVLSGNRIPLLLFFLSFFIYIVLSKELRKYFFVCFSLSALLLIFAFNANQNLKNHVYNFYNNGKYLVTFFFNKDLDKTDFSVWTKPYVSEFACAGHNIKNNPIFGGGIRSHRQYNWCNTHPHNYYLEILSELGVFGLGAILFFLFNLLRVSFRSTRNLFHFSLDGLDKMTIPYFLIFCMEFFPLRTSGSFFSTNNASIIFIVLGILVSLTTRKKANNHKKNS